MFCERPHCTQEGSERNNFLEKTHHMKKMHKALHSNYDATSPSKKVSRDYKNFVQIMAYQKSRPLA